MDSGQWSVVSGQWTVVRGQGFDTTEKMGRFTTVTRRALFVTSEDVTAGAMSDDSCAAH